MNKSPLDIAGIDKFEGSYEKRTILHNSAPFSEEDLARESIKSVMDAKLAAARTPAERRQVEKQLRHTLHVQSRKTQEALRKNREQKEAIEQQTKITKDVIGWMESSKPYKVEAPQGSHLHKLHRAAMDTELYSTAFADGKREFNPAVFCKMFEDATAILIEHDWRAAFSNASEDVLTGPITLPDDIVAFEFRISGRTVISVLFRSEETGDVCASLFIWTKHGWLTSGACALYDNGTFGQWQNGRMNPVDEMPDGPGNSPLLRLVASQVRAACVALDAEVAKTEIVRMPQLSNRPARGKKPLPAYSYHVVRLSNRHRVDAGPGAGDEGRRSPRLHFRRSHDRHYKTYKVRIKWQLVGNPELGWIEKHYKL